MTIVKIASYSQKVTKPCWGIGRIECHENILKNGIVSHEDTRSILQAAMELEDLQQFAANWLSESYRALVIDEVYDANALDLNIVRLASDSNLSVT